MYWVSISTQKNINEIETKKQFFHSITDTLSYINEIKNQDNMRILKIDITYVNCEVK